MGDSCGVQVPSQTDHWYERDPVGNSGRVLRVGRSLVREVGRPLRKVSCAPGPRCGSGARTGKWVGSPQGFASSVPGVCQLGLGSLLGWSRKLGRRGVYGWSRRPDSGVLAAQQQSCHSPLFGDKGINGVLRRCSRPVLRNPRFVVRRSPNALLCVSRVTDRTQTSTQPGYRRNFILTNDQGCIYAACWSDYSPAS